MHFILLDLAIWEPVCGTWWSNLLSKLATTSANAVFIPLDLGTKARHRGEGPILGIVALHRDDVPSYAKQLWEITAGIKVHRGFAAKEEEHFVDFVEAPSSSDANVSNVSRRVHAISVARAALVIYVVGADALIALLEITDGPPGDDSHKPCGS
jgi:hypothetical protein